MCLKVFLGLWIENLWEVKVRGKWRFSWFFKWIAQIFAIMEILIMASFVALAVTILTALLKWHQPEQTVEAKRFYLPEFCPSCPIRRQNIEQPPSALTTHLPLNPIPFVLNEHNDGPRSSTGIDHPLIKPVCLVISRHLSRSTSNQGFTQYCDMA